MLSGGGKRGLQKHAHIGLQVAAVRDRGDRLCAVHHGLKQHRAFLGPPAVDRLLANTGTLRDGGHGDHLALPGAEQIGRHAQDRLPCGLVSPSPGVGPLAHAADHIVLDETSGLDIDGCMPTDRLQRKRRLVKTFHTRIAKPITRHLLTQVLLETTGRTSGQPRRTPIGGRAVADQFWLVSDHGEASQYVRNIKADNAFRIRVRGRWRAGTAHLMPGDDAHARLARLPRFNSALVGALGTDLLTIRIDLD